jgi:hypothetical protein
MAHSWETWKGVTAEMEEVHEVSSAQVGTIVGKVVMETFAHYDDRATGHEQMPYTD